MFVWQSVDTLCYGTLGSWALSVLVATCVRNSGAGQGQKPRCERGNRQANQHGCFCEFGGGPFLFVGVHIVRALPFGVCARAARAHDDWKLAHPSLVSYSRGQTTSNQRQGRWDVIRITGLLIRNLILSYHNMGIL